MSMLLQLNGAIPESPHDRMFYVFACKEKTCRRKKGTVRALRGVKCTPETKPKAQEAKKVEETTKVREEEGVVNMGNFLFGATSPGPSSGSNPFSTARNGTTSNPFSQASTPATAPVAPMIKTFAETLKLADPPSTPARAVKEDSLFYGPPEPWPDPLPHVYPRYYLDAEYEMLEATPPKLPANARQMEDGVGDDMPMSGAAFESSLDKTFQKFADRVGQNPEQVLRYERNGHPLLYSKEDEVGEILLNTKGDFTTRRIPACLNCRKAGARVFEFQIMPHAITMLEVDEMGLDGMEWGTIIVGTCTCVPNVLDTNMVGYVEEWVGVQWESQK